MRDCHALFWEPRRFWRPTKPDERVLRARTRVLKHGFSSALASGKCFSRIVIFAKSAHATLRAFQEISRPHPKLRTNLREAETMNRVRAFGAMMRGAPSSTTRLSSLLRHYA
jgi:hypothetical protein